MRRYRNYDYDDRDYSVEDSVDEYDMRNFASPRAYRNMDYDDKNFWQPENEYQEREYGEDNAYGLSSERRRRLRPLGRRRRIFHDEDERLMHDRRRERPWLEDVYDEEGYAGRNESDYYGSYGDGHYYRTDEHNTSDIRNRNDYRYENDDGDDRGRRRTRWSEFFDERDRRLSNDGESTRRSRVRDRTEKLNREDDERGEFSDRKHPFGYHADLREAQYRRRRPYIRDRRSF